MANDQTPAHIAAIAEVVKKLQRRVQRDNLYYQMQEDKAKLTCNIIRDGRKVACAKVICRSNKRDAFNTYDLGLLKVRAGRDEAAANGIFFFLFVQFKDYLTYRDMTEPDSEEIAIGGRYDRGYISDVEPMVKIPYDKMRIIRKLDK
jgi:hypothetical protein